MTEQEIKSLLETTPMEDIKQLFEYLKIQHAENQAIAKGATQEEVVKHFLDERRKTNLKLAQRYPENPMGKTFDDCWAYIESNAQKAAKGERKVTLTSFTIFDWAVNYFCDDSIAKVEKAKTKPVATTKRPNEPKKTTLEDLQKAKEEWQKANDKKVADWEIQNNAAIDKFDAEHAMDLFAPENPYKTKENPYLKEVFPRQAELDKLLAEKPMEIPLLNEESDDDQEQEDE